MGIFGKSLDARISQVIVKEYGRNFSSEIVGGGYFYFASLDLFLLSSHAAFGSDGIAFVKKFNLSLMLKWSEILSCFKKNSEGTLEIIFWAPITSKEGIYITEPPFNNFHRASLTFEDAAVTDKFLEFYFDYKIGIGFTRESIALHDHWMQTTIIEPITLEQFHLNNKNWQTQEIREIAYQVWGDFLDAQRFMYYVGRNLCSGNLPPQFMDWAYEDFATLFSENAKYTNQYSEPDESFFHLMNQSAALSIFFDRKSESEWFMATVGVQADEWVGNMPIRKRRVAVNIYKAENGWLLLDLHNDFHAKTTIPALNWNPNINPCQIAFGEIFINFREEDSTRLSKILNNQ